MSYTFGFFIVCSCILLTHGHLRVESGRRPARPERTLILQEERVKTENENRGSNRSQVSDQFGMGQIEKESLLEGHGINLESYVKIPSPSEQERMWVDWDGEAREKFPSFYKSLPENHTGFDYKLGCSNDLGKHCLAESTEDLPTCKISVGARDGFGHQTFGRMSCVGLAMWAKGIEYVHEVPRQFDHLKKSEWNAARAIIDLNIDGNLSLLHPSDKTENMLTYGWLKFLYIAQGRLPCEKDRVYLIDNCWWFLRLQPRAFYSHNMKMKIRDAFFRSARSEEIQIQPARFNNSVVFEEGIKHVFVHLRAGGVRGKLVENQMAYYLAALQWTKTRFADARFYIHSDDHSSSAYRELIRASGAQELQELKGVFGLYELLERASLADILILGQSSLADVCAALSRPDAIIFTSERGVIPLNWTMV